MPIAVKALFYDVFGTLVDWRTSIAREAEAMLKPRGITLDWPAFADAWRGEYQGAMEEVRSGRIPFCKLDLLHRRNLDITLKKFIAPVSNGNISLMVDLARRNNLPWDAILGAEIAGDYKPKPRVYLAAAAAFDLPPEATMMVAAHSNDLAAAAATGLRTAHVTRPNEKGAVRGEAAPTVPVDYAVKSLEELAEKLGV
jgi:2-haloacid dehalogenase